MIQRHKSNLFGYDICLFMSDTGCFWMDVLIWPMIPCLFSGVTASDIREYSTWLHQDNKGGERSRRMQVYQYCYCAWTVFSYVWYPAKMNAQRSYLVGFYEHQMWAEAATKMKNSGTYKKYLARRAWQSRVGISVVWSVSGVHALVSWCDTTCWRKGSVPSKVCNLEENKYLPQDHNISNYLIWTVSKL